MEVGQAKTPDGTRIYAIGDIHGMDAALAAVHAAIATDIAARPVSRALTIHIGDYTDRGPDSAAVIERLAALSAHDPNVICLRGNHDQKLIDFLDNPEESAPAFFAFGGKATLKSYGVNLRGQNYTGLARQLAEKMPPAHRAFLDRLAYSVQFGDYFFCHAGVRPGVPLDQQTPDDLMWIRDEFLHDKSDHGAVIVHGHTPTADARPEVRENRIAIDTGCVYGGPLTCLVLEGSEVRFFPLIPGACACRQPGIQPTVQPGPHSRNRSHLLSPGVPAGSSAGFRVTGSAGPRNERENDKGCSFLSCPPPVRPQAGPRINSGGHPVTAAELKLRRRWLLGPRLRGDDRAALRARLLVPASAFAPGHAKSFLVPLQILPPAKAEGAAGARSSASRVVRIWALSRAPAVATLGLPRSRSGTEDGRGLAGLVVPIALTVAGYGLVFRPFIERGRCQYPPGVLGGDRLFLVRTASAGA